MEILVAEEDALALLETFVDGKILALAVGEVEAPVLVILVADEEAAAWLILAVDDEALALSVAVVGEGDACQEGDGLLEATSLRARRRGTTWCQ